MNFAFDEKLKEYIKKHNKKTLLVELIQVNNSDFEISELSLRFVDERLKKLFVEKQRYRVVPTEIREILLPPFPLEMQETVTFGLKSFLCFNSITCTGIKIE